jgi:hypothetical protein
LGNRKIRLLRRLATWGLNIALPFIALAFGRQLLGIVKRATPASPRPLTFLLGAVSFLPCWWLARRYMRRPLDYLSTLEHELTHILVGLLFFKRPLSLRVTARAGGDVVLTGGNLWITLAPYYLPTISMVLLALGIVLPPKSQPHLLAVLGASVSFHILSTWTELGVMQSDFKKAGLLQTVWLLPVANLLFYGSVVAYVVGSTEGFIHWWRLGGSNTLALLSEIFHYGFSRL